MQLIQTIFLVPSSITEKFEMCQEQSKNFKFYANYTLLASIYLTVSSYIHRTHTSVPAHNLNTGTCDCLRKVSRTERFLLAGARKSSHKAPRLEAKHRKMLKIMQNGNRQRCSHSPRLVPLQCIFTALPVACRSATIVSRVLLLCIVKLLSADVGGDDAVFLCIF